MKSNWNKNCYSFPDNKRITIIVTPFNIFLNYLVLLRCVFFGLYTSKSEHLLFNIVPSLVGLLPYAVSFLFFPLEMLLLQLYSCRIFMTAAEFIVGMLFFVLSLALQDILLFSFGLLFVSVVTVKFLCK